MKITNILGDRILLDVTSNKQEKTAGGIIIPLNQEQEKVNKGLVIKLGEEIDVNLQVGDVVIYDKYAGSPLKQGDQEYLIIKQDDILAVFKEE